MVHIEGNVAHPRTVPSEASSFSSEGLIYPIRSQTPLDIRDGRKRYEHEELHNYEGSEVSF